MSTEITIVSRIVQMIAAVSQELEPPSVEFDPEVHEVLGVLSEGQRRLYVVATKLINDYNADATAANQLFGEIQQAQNAGVDKIDSLRKLADGALSKELVERYAQLVDGLIAKTALQQAASTLLSADMQLAFPEIAKGGKAVILSDWSIAKTKQHACPNCGGLDLIALLTGGLGTHGSSGGGHTQH